MDEDDGQPLQVASPPLPPSLYSTNMVKEFRIGGQLVFAQTSKLLDPRRTVYRLELKQPLFLPLIQFFATYCPRIRIYYPGWFLPPIIILKKRKVGWEDEFEREKQVYEVLKPLQGTVIPYLYGEGVYDGSPALVLSFIRGKTVYELLREGRLPEDKDLEALRNSLQDALRALTGYGVEYTDMKTDNFLLTDDGRATVVDLEQAELNRANVWEGSTNNANVDHLMYQLSEPRRLALRRSTGQGLLPIPGAAKGQLVHYRG
ncbi:hypothetical protein QC761_0086030 [Podospora bellae-mahoneyi]|uniref:Protein kinase domain-containing protein n=1 Tax=Podospora bellae-mahoneyi TaxID=2093777 RepID=A0ABR0FHJ8_9PEZI|nr:hypothetical protein QC761_0086030 [Podospora bellae-mahoneyi]